MKTFYLFIYYSIANKFPTQPMPGYKLGYWLRRICLRHIAEFCGRDVIVKQHAYIGSGKGLKVGDRSQVGHNSRIDQNVTLGNDVVMGPDVVVMTNAHAFDDVDVPINQQGNLETREVVIGDDVWIGTRVIIMPGVTIGSGSVIGAGSIVTKDIPGMSIAVGNPARVIRNRGNV